MSGRTKTREPPAAQRWKDEISNASSPGSRPQKIRIWCNCLRTHTRTIAKPGICQKFNDTRSTSDRFPTPRAFEDRLAFRSRLKDRGRENSPHRLFAKRADVPTAA